jgi:hypothetical protein
MNATNDTHEQHSSAALESTLQFLFASDIPSQHKRVLIEVMTQALRDQEGARIRRLTMERADGPWQQHETAQLESFLQGKIAKGWQHADELVMRVATQLNRHPADVKAKATELGFGVGVDYRLAKALIAQQKQDD